MSLTRIYAIFLRQVYLLRGSLTRVIPIFVWIGVDMFLWGFMTRYLNSVGNATINFIPLLLGAILLWDFFIRVMQGVAMAFFEDIWSRNFLNFFASPLSSWEYMAGLILSSIATSMAGLILMLVVASSVFDLSFFTYGAPLIPLLLSLFVFGIALGIISITLVLRFGPAAEWLVWPIPALLSPLACVFYPLAMLPAWLQPVSLTLAPTYVFENLRALIAGHAADPLMTTQALGLSLLTLLLAALLFVRIYRKALATGLIARYSAESTN